MKFNTLESDGGKYLSLKDKESVIIVPRGEIFSYKGVWVNGKMQTVEEKNPAKHNRFKANVVVNDKDLGYVAKIFSFGVTPYNNLSDIASEMEITKTKIKLTRKGAGTDTTYTLVPLGQLLGTELQRVEAVKLHILAENQQKPAGQPTPTAPPEDETPWRNEPMPENEEELPF